MILSTADKRAIREAKGHVKDLIAKLLAENKSLSQQVESAKRQNKALIESDGRRINSVNMCRLLEFARIVCADDNTRQVPAIKIIFADMEKKTGPLHPQQRTRILEFAVSLGLIERSGRTTVTLTGSAYTRYQALKLLYG